MSTNKGWLIVAFLLFGVGFIILANGIQVFFTKYFRAPFSGNPVEGKPARISGGFMMGFGTLAVIYSGYLFWTRIILFL